MRPIRPIGPGDLRLGRDRADGEADEQHGADAEREAEDVDLPDRIAEADREEQREDRLGAEQVADGGQHAVVLHRSARAAAGIAEDLERRVHLLPSVGVGVSSSL